MINKSREKNTMKTLSFICRSVTPSRCWKRFTEAPNVDQPAAENRPEQIHFAVLLVHIPPTVSGHYWTFWFLNDSLSLRLDF